MSFNVDDYEPVASRIQRFYAAHPNGAIHCEIVHDDGTRVVIKATVWRDISDPVPAAIDYAEEILTDRGVNSTSRIENCATSSTGRAISIAAAGLAPSDWTKKPSREEMQKVARQTTTNGGPGHTNTVITSFSMPGQISDKQAGYIRGACKREDTLPPADLEHWSKQDASNWIDAHKNGIHAGSCPRPHATEEPF